MEDELGTLELEYVEEDGGIFKKKKTFWRAQCVLAIERILCFRRSFSSAHVVVAATLPSCTAI